MFDRMQYLVDPPRTIKFRQSWALQIRDSDGNLLGSFIRKEPLYHLSTKEARGWFEDQTGARLGELRVEKGHVVWLTRLEVYDPMDELRGKISCPPSVDALAAKFRDPFVLYDTKGQQIAASDTLSYPRGFNDRFESFRNKGLNIKSLNGSSIATIRGSPFTNSCLIDLYKPDIDRLLALSLIMSIFLF
jgi:hypothetical protein